MSWYSWWTGRIGIHSAKIDPRVESLDVEDGSQKIALVVGATGIVGNSLVEILSRPDTPGGPWKVYGVARRPKPDWFVDSSSVEYIQCDVLNRKETLDKISPLTDVTHLFWVTWVSRATEEENCTDNGCMLQNVLHVLLTNAPNFQHICLQTGGKHYSGPFSLAGKIHIHEPPFHEEMPRLPVPNFYYTLEDIVFDAARTKTGLTWSVHRPAAIYGFSPGSLMNLVGTLCVYAAICKREGMPFRYPGNHVTWDTVTSVSDADLIAEQEIWAATEPNAKNQAYNITNGDVFKYKQIWHLLAEKFELEVPVYTGEPVSLQEIMRDKGAVWEAMVKEHSLCATKLEDVGNWWFADLMLNQPVGKVLSVNKSKEHGFFGFRNTEKSTQYWIEKMREKKIIP
eukprot:c24323_g1_i1 orf=103-1293(+)